MANTVAHVPGFHFDSGSVEAFLNPDNLNKKINKAQYMLDSIIMEDMEPYMPKETGQFIALTKEISAAYAGSGKVCAGTAPMGRFLYEGKVMVGDDTGSAFAKLGEKKHVIDKDLTYNTNKNPLAGPRWFERAKADNGTDWVKLVKESFGGS